MNETLDRVIKSAVGTVVPGLVIQVVQDGEVLYEKTAGYRTVFPVEKPVTTDTRFDLASLTKVVTSTMILTLVSQSKLSLKTKLGSIFGSLASSRLNELFSTITIEELLTHTSGLPAWHPFYCRERSFFQQLDDLVPLVSKDRNVCYSDLNFILLGKIIERVTGGTLQTSFEDLIKRPLSLTTMDYGPVSNENVAATEFGNRIEMRMCKERNQSFSGWRNTEIPIEGDVNDGNTHYYFKGISGHAGLFAAIDDVTKFAQVYTEPNLAEKIGLDWELARSACSEHALGRGLGWQVSPLYMDRAGHTGFTGTSICVDPDERVVVTLLTNRLHQEKPTDLSELRQTIHETVFRYI